MAERVDLPKLALLLTPYVPSGASLRLEAMRQTFASWKQFMRYDGEIHIHVADDGSSPEYDRSFWEEFYSGFGSSFSYSHQERRGVGASLNIGFAACFQHTPMVFYGQDDWSLLNTINLTPWVEILMKDGLPCEREEFELGSVRFVFSPNLRGGRMVRCSDIWGIVWERYTYVFMQRPALYHKRFIDHYGLFPEMEKAVEVDRIFNDVVLEKKDGPEILLAHLYPWQHLWSIEAGDVVPPDNTPSDRFEGKVHTEDLPQLLS